MKSIKVTNSQRKEMKKNINTKRKIVHSESQLPVEEEKISTNVKNMMKKRKEIEIDAVKLSAKQFHYEKKKAVSDLHELQNILGMEPTDKEKELESFLFGVDDLDDFEDSLSEKEEEVVEAKQVKPAWEDDDETSAMIEEKAQKVQQKFKKVVGEPEWADLNRKQDSADDSNDELLQKTGNFIQHSKELPKGFIRIQKCPCLVEENFKSTIVKSVEFHPTCKVAVVAATNGTANLFQIDGKINAKIQSVRFENFPIHSAHFSTDGNEIIVGSNKFGHFFTYDMLSGKILRVPWDKGMEQKNIRRFQMSPDGQYMVILGRYGYIHLVTAKSKEWVGSLKMNGEVIAVTFNKDGSKMYSHGETGEVYIWDMFSRKCIHKFTDEGCIVGTSLAISPNDQFFAAGSDSGIVNIYDHSKLFESNAPQPLKVLKNLTTEVTQMKFNCSSEILLMNSYHKSNSVKLVHFPSMTVFSNFPLREDLSRLKYVNSLDISVNSGYMCFGNNLSTVHIFRLKHYNNY